MIGFVSALSSSLAIIILIMSVMMLNMIISAQSQQENSGEFTMESVDEDGEQEKEEKEKVENDGTIEVKHNLVSAEEISILQNIGPIKVIILQCEYGYTFDYNSAMKLTAFNSIAISKNIPNVEVKILKPLLQNTKVNLCSIKYERE